MLCPTVTYCRAVASHGVDVLAVHRDPETAAKLNRTPGVMAVCGSPESLPLNPCSFDAVLVHQRFHELAPGLVLPEVARVLRPDSVLGVSWLVRDDTVPWVKRLAALLRTVDERAMSGDYGTESVQELVSSKYFPDDEHTTKRLWVPVDRDSLIAMASNLPAVQDLDTDSRSELLTKVAALADDSAGISGLRLPYQLECWRAWVDHDELTTPIRPDDNGLTITL
ncbi:methyltransferase domain-containing protein [Cutibacterium avidum]|nr:methyltransferase domain-containing protein [Propionibacterium sp.]MCO6632772.1 class I SAM-dependent methyltransferase [Cutibacterium avidum]MCO6657060.1 class I SAM-dependent methyltransferase [Cutibacterium avidum]MCO6663173.1 class I SAM-dependent methyltransferase [Cutibacterium avidum]MCO6666406.1 class I SAM-dependent methyltransferase [Cutibacterium avidum]